MTARKNGLDLSGNNEDASRRRFLKSAALAVGALSVRAVDSRKEDGQSGTASPRPQRVSPASGSSQLFYTVETTSGKVQGIAAAGIKQFKGIPYGASTGGKNRFMPPKKPAPWRGLRECLGHGRICPQAPANLRSEYLMMMKWDQQPGGVGEDCLVLNVWTPAVNDSGKRAVLVSFHGGGFMNGSGNAPVYDGAQLALFGDVVVVTVNHRLASFGYTYLAGLGAPPEFAFAGVCGMMDLVAALQWVHDNIANFGGDPSRVLIFGQSGGGAKTSILMAIPSAKGLFHRAAVQSGSTLKVLTREEGTKLAEQLLAKLEIPTTRIADIQKVSWQQLLEAQTGIAGIWPVIDGAILPRHPFDPDAPSESADVPMIISTTLEEPAFALTNFDLDEAGLKSILSERYKDRAGEILPMYRKRYPRKPPFLIQAQVFVDAGFRRTVVTQAERKAAVRKAPAYMYLWNWESPCHGGKFGAVHGADVPASFHEVRNPIVGGGTPSGKMMCDRLASALVSFAKIGDPNNSQIPRWSAYDAATRATMVFDDNTHVENDPRSDIRKFWEQMPMATGITD